MGIRSLGTDLAWLSAGGLLVTWWTGDALITLSLGVLWFLWRTLVVPGLPPVLPLALSFQWVQVAGGLIYCVVLDRDLPTLHVPEYRTMVLLGLGCIVIIALGILIGSRIVGMRQYPVEYAGAFSPQLLLTVYAVLTVSEGSINQFAWQYPMLTQAIIAVGLIRLAVLYLLLRRFAYPELERLRFGAVLALEIALGFTGFFASFREPLAIATLVLYQSLKWRRAEHVAAVATLALVAVLSGTVWVSVRGQFRVEQVENTVLAQSRSARLSRVADLVTAWFKRGDGELGYDADFFVDRIWAVYYPSLALARVPSVIDYTGGRFVVGALRHITTPRFLFPDKPELLSDSEKVREYSGVWVAGREEGTTIAFGYAIESYVDYGVPLMFLPVLVYGTFMGIVFALFTRWIRAPEFGVPLLAVVSWLSLHLFEESWAKMLGDNITMFLYLGGVVFLLERFMRPGQMGRTAAPFAPAAAHVDLYPAAIGRPASRLSTRER